MALDTGIRIDFNSQPHEEADGVLIVSTSPSAYFNSQPHEEADLAQQLVHLLMDLFQLTASRRG